MDGLLLYLSLRVVRVRVSVWNLLLASAIGGAEAVVFPILALPVWAAYFVKAAGGIVIALIAVRRGKIKQYLIVVAAFFMMTFLFGGALIAVYSFFHLEYANGGGFIVARAPVSLVLCGAGVFAVLTELICKRFYRYRRMKRNLFSCTLIASKRLRLTGFSDSGNLLSFRGKPVCVISPVAALALFRGRGEVGRLTVKTVNGERDSPVFECDMTVAVGRKELAVGNVYVTVGDVQSKEYSVILHTLILEGADETVTSAEKVARKGKNERKRRKLSVRK